MQNVVVGRETTVGSDEKSPKHLVVISNDEGGEIPRGKVATLILRRCLISLRLISR
jgi:hypothetical protein